METLPSQQHFDSGFLAPTKDDETLFAWPDFKPSFRPDFSEYFGRPVKVFDTIIISDLHLGSKVSRAEELLEFLSSVHFKRLILNGDVFDSINMKRLNRHHWKVLSLLRKLTDKETHHEVVWIRGNHDGYADLISQLLGIEFRNQYMFEWQGQKILIFHGDIFDKFITRFPLLSSLADAVYRSIVYIDPASKKIGRWLKRNSKTFIRNAEKVRFGAVHYARYAKAQYVVCGHTHHVEDTIIEGVRYLNPGSWTDSPSHFIGITQDRIEIAEYL
jgi:UDP-2,3-diacylglucosamine pyrophosphatase LpxH